MTITEFARTRNEQTNTVSKYIREHPEMFEGHIKSKGKEKHLDNTALELLDKKYPLPKPVQIIQGVPQEEHFRAITERDEQIQKLQAVIIELQQHISDANLELGELRGKTMLLESKNEEIENLKEQVDTLKHRSFLERLFNK